MLKVHRAANLKRPCHRFRIPREQPRHLLRRLEVAVGVPLAAEAGLVDGDVVPDAGDDVLQDAPRRFMKQHVVGHYRRHAEPLRQAVQFVDAHLVVRTPAQC